MLTEEEKKFLKLKINDSIKDYSYKKRKQKFVYYIGSAAAVLFILFSLVYVNSSTDSSNIEQYVNSTDITIEKGGDVKLVLSDDEEISITEKTSNISYSSTGGNIRINNSQQIKQSSEDNYNTVVVPYGKRTKIVLSEGTQVWLNSGSRFTYPVVFNSDKREVHLVGEAIFDVSHNKEKPFYVVTNDYDVKVLGTVFNVSSYKEDSYTSTALESGSVEIRYSGKSIFGKSSLKITPGTLATYDNHSRKISSKRVSLEKYMSWRDGVFIFKQQRLDVILKKLSRYYNVKILVKNKKLNNETFSGHLDIKDDIGKVIEVIKQTTNLEYTIENNEILIN